MSTPGKTIPGKAIPGSNSPGPDPVPITGQTEVYDTYHKHKQLPVTRHCLQPKQYDMNMSPCPDSTLVSVNTTRQFPRINTWDIEIPGRDPGQSTSRDVTLGPDSTPVMVNQLNLGRELPGIETLITLVIGSVEGNGCSTKHEKLSSPQARLSFQSLVILTNL